MEYLKFIPEGWIETKENYGIDAIKKAYETGKTMQGFVGACDSNFNLQVKLSDSITGIIPRNEVDLVSSDEFGFAKPSVCKNKLNSFVQFKVKEIYDDSKVILSRKNANIEALDWMINNLKPGDKLKRNCKKH